MTGLGPWLLEPNLVQHAYLGGGGVARFRGLDPGSTPSPEDWVASVTVRRGSGTSGLSALPDGQLLIDAIGADPEGFLGPEHVSAFGPDPMLLVKILEPAGRIRAHCHPDREFAREHLGCCHGKTEAWFVISSGPTGRVYLGFSEELSRDRLDRLVHQQNGEEMLASLNALTVSDGDSVLVPAGVPHALGGGVLILELQEPTDMSVLLEPQGHPAPDLGLGWETVLGCVDRSAWSPGRLEQLRRRAPLTGGPLLPEVADPFFRAALVRAQPKQSTEIERGFAVLVVTDGQGLLHGSFDSSPLGLHKGMTVLVPYAVEQAHLTGSLDAVVCRPPPPSATQSSRPLVPQAMSSE